MNTGTIRHLSVCEALAEDMRALGTQAVFGLMSDDTAVFAVTLDAMGIQFYGTRHENTAIAMADAYAEATGGLAFAVVGRGPATANGLHAAVYAGRTGSKVVIIYGEEPVAGPAPNSIGPDYKAFNAGGVLSAAGLPCFVATSAKAARAALADAVAAAMLGQAVTLRLPTNVQLAQIEVQEDAPESMAATVAMPAPAPARSSAIATACTLLENAERPLIIGGYGAHLAGAKAVLERLADRIGAALVTTARAKDMFRGHPLNLDIIGSFSHSAARRLVAEADCVIAFGAGLNFLSMSFGDAIPQVPLIQVDSVRASIGRWTTADIALVGDARLVAEQLLDALAERPAERKPFHSAQTRDMLAAFDLGDDFEAAHTARTIDPRSLAIELDKMLPAKRNFVYDGGNFLGVVPYLRADGPSPFQNEQCVRIDWARYRGGTWFRQGTTAGDHRARHR